MSEVGIEAGVTGALTVVVAVSIAVERVTEILKQMLQLLNNDLDDPSKDGRRRAALQVLAAVVGFGIAAAGQLTLGPLNGYSAWVAIGLMSSGGSGFWNHALDAMRAMKINKEAVATEKQALSKQLIAK